MKVKIICFYIINLDCTIQEQEVSQFIAKLDLNQD